MASDQLIARARSDGEDRLVEADEPLAGMQLRCGGELPGTIAAPALLELVRKARVHRLSMARPIRIRDANESILAWIEVRPDDDGEGCRIGLANWQASPLPVSEATHDEACRTAIDRDLAELVARLDGHQQLLAVEGDAPDLEDVVRRMRAGSGRPWTDFVTIEGDSHQQPLHWRLLDGAALHLPGSQRRWIAHLVPQGAAPQVAGFELYLVADEPLAAPLKRDDRRALVHSAAIGREIAPVLRQPIARIIANAETIRSRLAGPLAEEYSNYASDIASAGEHLLALIDDLSALEVIEAEDFSAAPDRIELGDVARRAVAILQSRAQERGISIDLPAEDEDVAAIGEFRRVLQVLLNLIGNAIRYAPEGSDVWIRLERKGIRARVTVADQGPGLSRGEQARMFDKFERLGRANDGGTGLGLYISRRLARAMHGELTVESAPGQGARFTLELPADL